MSSIILDITRLLSRLHHPTPTGIDRFELNYARWLRGRENDDAVFVESGSFGPVLVPPTRVDQVIERLSRRWAGAPSDSEAGRLHDIIDAIDTGEIGALWKTRPPAPRPNPLLPSQILRAGLRKVTQCLAARPILAQDARLVHVSHAKLDKPSAYDWLRRHNEQGLFYVHDLIPVSHPEFVRGGEAGRHIARIKTVLLHAGLVLCNSQSTANALDRMAARCGLAQPRSSVLPPGVEDTFVRFPKSDNVLTRRPYFLCVGTIEPRKNHALLLNIWRRLVERDGKAAPRLVLVGRRGWDNAQTFKVLDQPGIFRHCVIEIADLDDHGLARLVGGASALLAPSFVEGYDLPVAEALTLGTPVIASDIAAHREIAGSAAVLVDPLNGRDWVNAIDVFARRRKRASHQVPTVKPWTWADHFNALERLLETARRPRGATLQTRRAGDGSRQGSFPLLPGVTRQPAG